MRSDFAVFILTHGRADNVVTVPAIKKAGYTGKIYFITRWIILTTTGQSFMPVMNVGGLRKNWG